MAETTTGTFIAHVDKPDRRTINADHLDIHQTIRRATTVLEILWRANGPLRLVKIAQEIDLDKSTALRLLHSLEELGYVHKDEASKTYMLGYMSQRLGARAMLLRSNTVLAERFMTQLVAITGLPVGAASLEGTSVIYWAVHEPPECPSYLKLLPDVAYPAHSCAPGKLLLGNLRSDKIETLYSSTRLERLASHTVTDRQQLAREARDARNQGFAFERDEAVEGRSAVAVAVVNSRGVANMAIVVQVPTAQFGDERRDWLLRNTRESVVQIYDHVLC